MDASEFSADRLTLLPFGLPGKIYRSPMPFRKTDEDGKLFEQFQAAGVDVVVVLADAEECLRKTGRDLIRFYTDQGLYVIHCPIPDFHAPSSPEVLAPALDSVLALARQGKTVAAHCYAGFGRTGLFMGCLARRALGLGGEEAVTWVRLAVPTALENEEQVRFVHQFEGGNSHVD
jgi:protein-tyrosine phosphatase